AIGGIVVSHEVARALDARALFTEREDGVMGLRPGVTLAARERCLGVGGGAGVPPASSLREVIPGAGALGGTVVGVGSLIDRSGGGAHFPVKRAALAPLKATTWEPEKAPLCPPGRPAGHP